MCYLLRAFTPIRSRCIDTYRAFTTNVSIRSTFVDVNTNRALGFESVLTKALTFDAFSICCTIEITLTQNIDIDLFASDFRVWLSRIALWAFAIVAGICIFTNCTRRTWLLQCVTFINIRTTFVGISSVVGFTGTQITARRIRTHSISTTWIFQAFIYI